MIREEDIITRITHFAARLAGMDEQQRRLLEYQIRQEYRGEKSVYFRRSSADGIEERDAKIMAAIRAGERYRSIAARLSISVGTVCAVRAKKKPVQVLGKN